MDTLQILARAVSLLDSGEHVALVTVIWATGSTPGKAGYKMLVLAGGEETVGTVGGGLVEAKMIRVAAALLASPTSRLLRFDLNGTADDENGICGGSVEFLVETFDKGSLPMLKSISQSIGSGRAGALISAICPEKPPLKVFMSDEAATAAGAPTMLPLETIKAVRRRQTGDAGRVCAGGMEVFVEGVKARPTLLLVGAGHLATHICKFAKAMQFCVKVYDDRSEYANRDRFPDADDVVVGSFEDVFDRLKVDKDSYIVIVTRGHKCDQTVLESAVRTNAGYIGMIGSKRKSRTILRRLAARGVHEELLDRVYSPIGISIGAVTPEEIALSIVCELVKTRRLGRQAHVGHMKDSLRPDAVRQGP